MRAGPYHPERVPVRAVRDHRAAERILTGQDTEKVETKEVHINEYGTDDYSRLALTRLMYDTRMSWGMKFAGEV